MQFATLTTLILACVVQAQAASFSLQTYEPVNEAEVPTDCFAVYSTTVPACGSKILPSCSDDCLTALASLASDIQVSCGDAFVGMDSLLRRAVDGGLLSTLCDTYEAPSEIVDSTMEASNIILSTIYPSSTKSASPIPTKIAIDDDKPSLTTVAASTRITASTRTTAFIAVDTSPAPTTGIASAQVDELFASASPSATASAFPDEGSAGGRVGTSWSLLLAGVAGAVLLF